MKPDYLLAVLDKKSRDSLDTSEFAIPETRSYPIPDLTHARVALAMVKMHGNAEEQAKVRAAVVRKYPALKLSNSARDVLFAEAAERGLLDLGMDGAKWKHGYIPLNAIAAAIKAKKWHGHGGSKGNLPSGKSRINVGSNAAHAMAPKGKARATAAQRARAEASRRNALPTEQLPSRTVASMAKGELIKRSSRLNHVTPDGFAVKHSPEFDDHGKHTGGYSVSVEDTTKSGADRHIAGGRYTKGTDNAATEAEVAALGRARDKRRGNKQLDDRYTMKPRTNDAPLGGHVGTPAEAPRQDLLDQAKAERARRDASSGKVSLTGNESYNLTTGKRVETTSSAKTVHLQAVGKHPAKALGDIQPGEHIVYNYGSRARVVSTERKGSMVHHTTQPLNAKGEPEGPTYVRKGRAGTLVGYAPAAKSNARENAVARAKQIKDERTAGVTQVDTKAKQFKDANGKLVSEGAAVTTPSGKPGVVESVGNEHIRVRHENGLVTNVPRVNAYRMNSKK